MPRRRPHLFSGGDGDDPARRRRGLHYVASTGAARGARAGETVALPRPFFFFLFFVLGVAQVFPVLTCVCRPSFAVARLSPSRTKSLLTTLRTGGSLRRRLAHSSPCAYLLCLADRLHEIPNPDPREKLEHTRMQACVDTSSQHPSFLQCLLLPFRLLPPWVERHSRTCWRSTCSATARSSSGRSGASWCSRGWLCTLLAGNVIIADTHELPLSSAVRFLSEERLARASVFECSCKLAGFSGGAWPA